MILLKNKNKIIILEGLKQIRNNKFEQIRLIIEKKFFNYKFYLINT